MSEEHPLIDAHLHMMAAPLMKEWADHGGPDVERIRQQIEEGRKRRKGAARGEMELLDVDAHEMARIWNERLAAYGVRQGVFMSPVADSAYFRVFATASPGSVFACCTMDPREHWAAEKVREEIAAGYVGVKLFPVNRAFSLSDERARPFFDAVAELGVPVCIHYGVSVDPRADLRYADPIDLSPVARDYPSVEFVIAHFGAGYLREVLALSYQCPNVYVDSSGTNNWIKIVPYCQTLRDVFSICLEALGPERILFGTDSGAVPAGYRDWILTEQLAVLDSLGLTPSERAGILGGNAARVYGLPSVA